jgi:hypothetical protein
LAEAVDAVGSTSLEFTAAELSALLRDAAPTRFQRGGAVALLTPRRVTKAVFGVDRERTNRFRDVTAPTFGLTDERRHLGALLADGVGEAEITVSTVALVMGGAVATRGVWLGAAWDRA